jgi:hypothetical protein
MIRELIQYWMTPASPQARQSGYLYESIAFESRARRLGHAWKSHWQTCHELVSEFMDQHSEARSLIVYGSGSLFEIPRSRLVQQLDHLILVDQVFPRSVRSWVRAQNENLKVELIEADLAQGFPKHCQAELAISANLLSQLTLPHTERAEEIEWQHLDSLRQLKTPVLLWTDTKRFFHDRSTGENVQQECTVQRPLLQSHREWIWNLAPAPELHRSYDVRLGMQACVW